MGPSSLATPGRSSNSIEVPGVWCRARQERIPSEYNISALQGRFTLSLSAADHMFGKKSRPIPVCARVAGNGQTPPPLVRMNARGMPPFHIKSVIAETGPLMLARDETKPVLAWGVIPP